MQQKYRKKAYIQQHTAHGRLQRDERFDNVRGALILLVVIGHFLLPMYQTRLITGIVYAIYVFHMPCFVMVSGYYAKSVMKRGRFRWGKVVQLLWLYGLYEAVVDVTEGLLDGAIPLLPDFCHESGAPWYLIAMAFFYLTIPLFYRVRRPRTKVVTVIGMMLFACFGKYVIHTGSFLSLDRVVSFLPFFYVGYFSNQDTMDWYQLRSEKKAIGILTVLLLGIVFLFTYDFLLRYNLVVFGTDYRRYSEARQPWLWLYNAVWYGVALTISIGFIGSMLNRRMFLLTDLGRNTLQIYFLHRPVRDLMQLFGFYDWINPHSKLHVLGLIVFCILLTVVLSNTFMGRVFARLRSLFDPLLEKAHAL